MSGDVSRHDFQDAIESALDLLRDHTDAVAGAETATLAQSLPSLLQQCQDMLAGVALRKAAPLRTVHQLACTGGTLICRCIGALPNTQVLSEVDPLSPQAHRHRFLPADMVALAKFSSRPSDEDTLLRIFLSGLRVLQEDTQTKGIALILRDHAHSHFNHGPDIPDRPSLREILGGPQGLLSVVILRHPLDSFLSLTNNSWLHFTPKTLEEYARRYHVFLDHHADLEWLRYEDFVAEPEAWMQRLCGILDLAYHPAFRDLFPAITLSGDSGRKSDIIAPRPRRSHSPALLAEARASERFMTLLPRMCYDLED